MAPCNYEGCSETPYGDSPWCILHLDFPKEDDPEFTRIQDEKQLKTKEKIKGGDLNFEGTNIYDVDASHVSIPAQNDADFKNATIRGWVTFDGAEIGGNASFDGAEIGGDARFDDAEIGGDASFCGAKIGLGAWFDEAEIRLDAWFGGPKIERGAWFDEAEMYDGAKKGGDARFNGAKIGGDASFQQAEIGGDALFYRMTIGGRALFDHMTINGAYLLESATIKADASFKDVQISKFTSLIGTSIGGSAWFDRAKIGCLRSSDEGPSSFDVASVAGTLSFDRTQFACLEAEEAAYRAAKRNCTNRGADADADDCFFREMVARRKQKKQPIKSLELVVQYGLGYGACPSWLLGWWVLIAFVGAIALALASSQWQNLGFGFAAAFVPGYGISRAQSGIAEWVAAIETIVNFFLLAAFIAVFSRRYID